MTYQPSVVLEDLSKLTTVPAWATARPIETQESLAFRCGAACTVLDTLITSPIYGVPTRLLANRLALKAATSTSKLEGRLALAADIRDAYHLTPSDAARGPDGDLLAFWRDIARLRIRGRDWIAGVNELAGSNFEDVEDWIGTGIAMAHAKGPLAGCVWVMRVVLSANDRSERIACMLSDIVMARALNWTSVIPVSSHGLTKASLRNLVADEQDANLEIQSRILKSVEDTITQARELAYSASALRSVAPKLRAKGSDAAVALFLAEDAVAPSSMLAPTIQGTSLRMTDRAARRFCDRLVALGVAQELTGRPTFRLYGIAP